jgi:polyisoprenoid-binding protein YceI
MGFACIEDGAIKKIAATLLAIMLSGVFTCARRGNFTPYTLDRKQSRLEIRVSREGFLKALGHDHVISATELSGQIQLAQLDVTQSSVTFVAATSSLVVVDPGEAEKDRNEVQSTMLGDKVLDAARYPQIQFTSSGVRSVTQKEGMTELQIEGTLRLHGVEKLVTIPVRLRMTGGNLTGDGELPLLQSNYGIAPIKVGGGAVRVKDKLKISFHIVAEPLSESEEISLATEGGSLRRVKLGNFAATSTSHRLYASS